MKVVSTRIITNYLPKRANFALVFVLVVILASLFIGKAYAKLATATEMEQVCRNWVTYMLSEKGTWASSTAPEIIAAHDIEYNGVILARYYDISPRGFVLVPVLKEMPPVTAYSDESNLDESQEGGFLLLMREILSQRMTLFETLYGDPDVAVPDQVEAVFDRKQRDLWDTYAAPADKFAAYLSEKAPMAEAGPLLTSSWHQGAPYNNLCPSDRNGKSVVGCTATAISQLLNFWKWPAFGNGSHSYTWRNTYCGRTVPPQTLNADFSDPYDWANILDSCDDGCTADQQAAAAELCYEVGVSVDMDYGSCGSAAGYSIMSLINYFRYGQNIRLENRVDHDLDNWFAIIRNDIDAGRPLLYGINMHSIVCDGYRDLGGGQYEYHMNYGWGNGFNAWYSFDNLYCGWVSGDICPYEQDNLLTGIEPQTGSFVILTATTVDEVGGDGDGHADAGESVSIGATAVNHGWDAENVQALLTSDDPYLQINTATMTFASPIPWDSQRVGEAPFILTVDPACPDPHVARLEITVTADGGYSVADTLLIYVGDTPGFSDNMEAGAGDWQHTTLITGFREQWHLETGRFHSAGTSWKNGKSGPLNYSDYQDACLITPPFLLPSDAELTFWHWMEAETGGASTAWDGGIVMMSLQYGAWFQIYPEGGYPYELIDNAANPLPGGTPCYSGYFDWTQASFDLSAYSGVARLMFRFGIDGAANEEGWYVDDVLVRRPYVCGDANNDTQTNVGDAVFIINYVFKGGAAPDPENAGNPNCDDNCDIGDAVYMINYAFKSGNAPCADCP